MLERIIEKTTFKDAGIILISALAIISLWRGIWGLMDIYLFPTKKTISLIISILFGLIILFLIAMHKNKKVKWRKGNN